MLVFCVRQLCRKRFIPLRSGEPERAHVISHRCVYFCFVPVYFIICMVIMLVVFNPYLSYHQFIYFITLFIDCQMCDLFCTCDGPEEPHEVSHRRAVFTGSCCSCMFMQNLSHFWMSEEACGRTLCLCVCFFTCVYLHLLLMCTLHIVMLTC